MAFFLPLNLMGLALVDMRHLVLLNVHIHLGLVKQPDSILPFHGAKRATASPAWHSSVSWASSN